MEQGTFQLFLGAMSIIALFVFIALYFVKAGYGMFRTASWGISINNKLAWMLMEAPVFIVMLLLWWNSARYNSIVPLIFFLLFQLHYLQRAFVFPFLLKGKKMVLLLKSGISVQADCHHKKQDIEQKQDYEQYKTENNITLQNTPGI